MESAGKQESGTRLAISTEGEEVAAHFGRCPAYTLVDISDGRAQHRECIPNPGHEPGFLPGYLAERGVTAIICGGMGPRAQMLFDERNIQTIVGVSGSIDAVIEAYLRGELRSGESTCDH